MKLHYRDGQLTSLTQAEVHAFTDDQINALEKTTQKLADEAQRQAAGYQRTADRLRKEIKRRKAA